MIERKGGENGSTIKRACKNWLTNCGNVLGAKLII